MRRTLLTVLAFFAAAAPASAGKLERVLDSDPDAPPNSFSVQFTAAPGESNDLALTVEDGHLVARDTREPIAAGDGCQVAGGAVRCTLRHVYFSQFELGDGDDRLTVTGDLGIAAYEAGPGDDEVFGGTGYETIAGGPGVDRLHGRDGVDNFSEGEGAEQVLEADLYDGGPGRDEMAYGGRTGPVVVDLAAGTGPDGDRLDGVESAVGGAGADVLLGGRAGGRIVGGPGDDRIGGRAGDDLLYGGEGADAVAGGPGDDELVGEVGDDRLDGGSGDDELHPGDAMTCGAGTDAVLTGRRAHRVPRDCEFLVALAERTGLPKLRLSAHPRRRRGGRLEWRARCGSRPCRAAFTLRTPSGRGLGAATLLRPGTFLTRRPKASTVVALLDTGRSRYRFRVRLP